jgi:UDP-glucose 4-epimerase
MTKHVLVTGGAGFIASHLADAYLARGWRVSVVDDLSTGKWENLDPGVEFHQADLRDLASMDLVRQLRPDVVSHHGAQIDVRKSVADPAADAETNVVASVRLLQTCAESGVGRFIFASTGGAIYGDPLIVPQGEDHPARPLSPYGCAKLSVEHYLEYFREVHGLSTVALRYANVYGPRQNAKGEAGVIAIFLERLLSGQPATINGDGSQTRDFVYVEDVVNANMAVSENVALTGAWNVGTGVEVSVSDIYRLLAAAVGTDAPPQHVPAKPGEQLRSILDPSRLRRRTSLPDPVALEEGIRRTTEWFRGR